MDAGLPSLRQVEEAARARRLAALVDELQRAGDERGDRAAAWLARALRVDLATITQRPSLALTCVWRRALFVREPDGSHPLRALLGLWREENGDRPWARALRPPAEPLWGALREEYRGAFGGVTRVAVRDEGIALVRDGAAYAIDRRTGEVRPDSSDAAAAARPAWQLARDLPLGEHWGRLRVRDPASGRIVVELRVNDDDSYGDVAADDAGATLFAAGWWDDYAGVVTCVDVARGAVRWRAELARWVTSLSCSPDGGVVMAFSSVGMTLFDGATGATLRQVAVTGGVGAIDPSGRLLATVSEAAVRLWSLEALAQPVVRWPRGADDGFAYALWSPDGARLLTGMALCDGVGGRLVKTLKMDGPGYLEGGPAPGARGVGAALVVEFHPMRGAVLWDARTGAHLATDASRAYGLHRDALWLAPDAERYVHGRRGDFLSSDAATLRATRDGALLASLGDGVTAVAWSPDSARVAVGYADGSVRVVDREGALGFASAPADGAVRGLCFDAEGALLVGGGEGATLRVWDAARGALRGERPLRDDERAGQWSSGERTVRFFSATPELVDALDGTFGFRAPGPPHRAVRRDGFVWLEPRAPSLPRICLPEDDPVVAEPTGRRWASPSAHYALEPA